MHEKIQKKKKELEEKKLQKEEEERAKKMKEEELELKARKDVPEVPKKVETFEVHDIEQIDQLEDNPAKILQCAFCQRKGQRKLSGRLIPFRANQFIHVNCALWTDGVFDDKEGHIINFYFAYKKARIAKCSLCHELGASISCRRDKCDHVYHFPCALKLECHFTYYTKYTLYCPGCAKLYNIQPNPDKRRILDTKRRVYIVKHKDFEEDPSKCEDIKIDTWRPYFYDSFNRVGNCTILSLCESVDALIKVIKGGSFSLHNDSYSKSAFLNNSNFNLKPYTSLRIYWKIVKDTTLDHESLISEANVCRDKTKAFYLSRGDDVQIYLNSDCKILRKNASETITQRLWGSSNVNYSTSLEKASVSSEVSMSPEPLTIKGEHFWDYITRFIRATRPNFTFANIDFKYKTFTAEEKFPVQFWNTAKADTKDKLLSSVEAHWLLAQSYDKVEGKEISTDLFRENVIKINHGKEKISSLFQKSNNHSVKLKTGANLVQSSETRDDYETITDQKNLPISMRYRRYRENPKRVLVGPSKIHCQGLFALEHFSQGDIVIEYVGEIIDNQEADRRERYYEKSGMSD